MVIPQLEQQKGPDFPGKIRPAALLIGALHFLHLPAVEQVLLPQELVGEVPADQIAVVLPHPPGKRDPEPHLFLSDQCFRNLAAEQIFQNPLLVPILQFEFQRETQRQLHDSVIQQRSSRLKGNRETAIEARSTLVSTSSGR